MPADTIDPTDPDFREDSAAPRKADGLLIRFFHQAHKTTKEVEGKVRTVWEKREMVEIRNPGDRLNAPVKIVTDVEKERWPAQYAAWKAGQDQETAGGWPLEKWPGADVAQVEALRFHKVRTVEQFAAMSDANLANLGPGWRPLRQAAKDFLAASESAAPMAALRKENDELRSQQEADRRMINELGERLKKLEGKGKAA